LNRVIRNPSVAVAPAYGVEGRQFVDGATAELLETVRAEAFEAGRREGFAAGRSDMEGAIARVSSAVQDAVASLRALRSADIDQTIAVALEIAEFVVGQLPPDEGGALGARIRDAIANLDDEDIVVAVHPQDWDTVSSAVSLPPGVTMDRDPTLRPGEARIAGRWATADLTREAALQIAREVLL
jgi:flagellar biosynthesis/type III secretory pathway protein FliH